MARTKIRQDSQVFPSDSYDDGFTSGPSLESDSDSLQFDLNAIRSQIRRITGKTNWYDTPSGSGGGSGPADLSRMLIAFIDDGPVEGYSGGFREIVGAPWPTSITWYTDQSKTAKIVEKLITRNSDQAPTMIVWRLYDADGVTPLISSTDTIANTGTPAVFEATRVRVIT